jgi:hypothetical protein
MQRREAVHVFEINIGIAFHQQFDAFDRFSNKRRFRTHASMMQRRLQCVILNIGIRSVFQKEFKKIGVSLKGATRMSSENV